MASRMSLSGSRRKSKQFFKYFLMLTGFYTFGNTFAFSPKAAKMVGKFLKKMGADDDDDDDE